MPWWRRRKETLNEKLMREAGLTVPDEGSTVGAELEPHDQARLDHVLFRDTLPFWEQLSGEVTVPRPRRWDAVASASAPDLPGTEVHFVAGPDGTLFVEEEVPPDALAPLAEAIEETIPPPYKAEGVRRGEHVWAVGARRVDVIALEEDPGGDALELVTRDGERELRVDGERAFGGNRQLEQVGERQGDSYVVRAARLDGELWEVEVAPL